MRAAARSLRLAILFLAAMVSSSLAQTDQARKLAGMPWATHVDVTVDSLARVAGVDQDSLQSAVESRLQDAGFETMAAWGSTSLKIEVHAFQVSTTSMLVYEVGLEYHTFAVPAGRLSALVQGRRDTATVPVGVLKAVIRESVGAAIYRRAVYGMGPRKLAPLVRHVVLRNVEVFTGDFRAANPPRPDP